MYGWEGGDKVGRTVGLEFNGPVNSITVMLSWLVYLTMDTFPEQA